MLYIVENVLPYLPAKDWGLYPLDGDPLHMWLDVPLIRGPTNALHAAGGGDHRQASGAVGMAGVPPPPAPWLAVARWRPTGPAPWRLGGVQRRWEK